MELSCFFPWRTLNSFKKARKVESQVKKKGDKGFNFYFCYRSIAIFYIIICDYAFTLILFLFVLFRYWLRCPASFGSWDSLRKHNGKKVIEIKLGTVYANKMVKTVTEIEFGIM